MNIKQEFSLSAMGVQPLIHDCPLVGDESNTCIVIMTG